LDRLKIVPAVGHKIAVALKFHSKAQFTSG
jgi:hypothetical protein